MSENENKSKLEAWSCKLTKETKENIASLQNSGDFSTVNQMVETLIERYNAPIKMKDQSDKIMSQESIIEDLKTQLSQLREEYNILRDEKSNCSDDIGKLNNQIQELSSDLENVRSDRDGLEKDLINFRANSELPHNGRIIIIDPLNWAILEKVAEREGKKRDQAWTPDDVINYFIHFRFEKGSFNGDLKSLPDKVISQLKETIETKEV